ERGIAVIEDGRVVTIAGPEEPIPAGAAVREVACLVPGLINAHVHLEVRGEPDLMRVFIETTPTQRALVASENARRTLLSGVTTVRDLGGSERIALEVRDAVAAGTLAGPTILAAARPICMTGGHGWFVGREADGPWDVRKAVREQLRAGADCIKFIATGGVLTKGAVPGIDQLGEDELAAGIAEAHTHGLRCAAHAIGTSGIRNALRAGIDSIEHGHLVDDEGIALFLERGAFLVPTLAAIEGIVANGSEAGIPEFAVRKARELGERAHANLRQALAAGVRFAGGSDAGTPFNRHDDYARELELMEEKLGLPRERVLVAATGTAGELLGTERGRIASGAPADLLGLRSGLASDARPFREPALVVKDGRIVHERAA
ncbi:MAG: amidohydrolase family protein, partial [Vulcanimicrobiaceae bacterium]